MADPTREQQEEIANRENQKMLASRLKETSGFKSLIARGGFGNERFNDIRKKFGKPEFDSEELAVQALSVHPSRELVPPQLSQDFVNKANAKEGAAQEAFISGYGDYHRKVGEKDVWETLAKVRRGDLKPEEVPHLDDMVEGMLMRLFEDTPLPVMVDSGVDMADSIRQVTKKDYLILVRDSVRKFLDRPDLRKNALKPQTLERLQAIVG